LIKKNIGGGKELKLLNPWLREPHLNNKSGRLYRIKVK